MYAEVNVIAYRGASRRTFTYLIGESVGVRIGGLVEIRFGNKASIGIVHKITNLPPPKKIKLQNIKSVLDISPLPKHLLVLGEWIIDYYVATPASVWQLMIPRNPTTKPSKQFANPSHEIKDLVRLTPAQSKAYSKILNSTKPVLLQGAMGSGKTEIYFHLIDAMLRVGKSAILLMPEIFLTNQMIERAQRHFADKLVVTHSGLTPAERRAAWVRCSNSSQSSPLVILGARSALFMPVNNLGTIIVDECHEQSYKQDSSPRYQSEMVAAKLAKITEAKLVLGSATPSINTRFLADAGKLECIKLEERAISSAHPHIKIIQKNQPAEIFSTELTSAINSALKQQKLTMLYLNRRGTAPIFTCNDCGHNFECPHCRVNLHLHADSMRLICHICNYSQAPPGKCPACDNTNLRGIGIGTKAVVQKAGELFENARIVRIDRDSFKPREFNKILSEIAGGKVDIIVGTQMIGRGIDLANLHLVGIIDADYDLINIDYNSLERAFQLLSQTAGRAGRRSKQGEVIIQTKNADNKFFELITSNNYESFYQSELALRKKYSYPPYSYLLKLECGFVSSELGRQKALELIEKLTGVQPISILGPVPAHPALRGRRHIWNLIIKSRDRKILANIASQLDAHWTINLDPFGIS